MSQSAEARPTLAKVQRWMQAVITHPGGVLLGVQSEAARAHLALDCEHLESLVLPSGALSSSERLAVYSNAYFSRLLECMRELFPALRHALGDETFDALAAGYVSAYPPQSYTLGRLSEHFVRFLSDSRQRVARPEETWPDFVIDLATLEWQIDQVFDGPGSEQDQPLSAERLSHIDPHTWPAVRLVPAACLRVMRFRFPVNDYYSAWRAIASSGERTLPIPPASETYLALTRRDYIVRRHALNSAQYALLSALIGGAPVGEAVAAAAGQHEALDQLADQLGRWFQQWAAEGFFSAVELP